MADFRGGGFLDFAISRHFFRASFFRCPKFQDHFFRCPKFRGRQRFFFVFSSFWILSLRPIASRYAKNAASCYFFPVARTARSKFLILGKRVCGDGKTFSPKLMLSRVAKNSASCYFSLFVGTSCRTFSIMEKRVGGNGETFCQNSCCHF